MFKLKIMILGSIFGLITQTGFAATHFESVRAVLADQKLPANMSNEALTELNLYKNLGLPQYQVNMRSIFSRGSAQLEADGKRTIKEKADYYDRLEKLIHNNGVCVSGQWIIDPGSSFSGALSAGTNPFIGRISVAMQNTQFQDKRGFGFAGKVFSRIQQDGSVPSENFFSVDVLMGQKNQQFLKTATTNQPETGFDFGVIALGFRIASALSKADENPGFRSIWNLSQLDLNAGSKKETLSAMKYPKWIRISSDQSIKTNDEADFRREVTRAVQENGKLIFNVDYSNTSQDRHLNSAWNRLGQIRVNEAFISYGCDRQLHFAHPKLKPSL